MMKTLEKWSAIILLIGSIGFNLWIYRTEPTVKIDPNDNAFQYALVDRTNTIWDYANRMCPANITSVTCHLSLLTDHWVPNWEEGYNLPYYYSHIPQILIVGSYRLLPHMAQTTSLFVYYHVIIYLLLCILPLSLFLAFRIMGLPWITGGFAALLASQISTDGLYGIDPSSFLWRGWGLSSQLFALIWFPLAIATCIRSLSEEKKSRGYRIYTILSVFFLLTTTMGHLGIGMMAFMSIAVICMTPTFMGIIGQGKWKETAGRIWTGFKQTCIICLPVLILLSYWILPTVTDGVYHNISVWDPVWKFNSFGVTEVMTKFVNGEVFDFGRLPIFTLLVIVGIFVCFLKRSDNKRQIIQTFPFLFVFFLLLFFGNTTWGSLMNLIPGMADFHQHRFIVALHLSGLFLAPIGLTWVCCSLAQLIASVWKQASHRTLPMHLSECIAFVIVVMAAGFTLFPQTIRYAAYNDTLITEANRSYETNADDIRSLRTTLQTLEKTDPGRVFALRGTEGKNFQVASISAWYMYLSTYGIPTVLWLPETWSLNADTEQFFSEDNASHYALYNIRYVVAPPDKKPQTFWHLIKETASWKLYTVADDTKEKTQGYVSIGTSPSVVTSGKQSFINLIHLWIQSDYPEQQLYPQLVMRGKLTTTLPHFSMTDEVTYTTPDAVVRNLFAQPPVYIAPFQTADTDTQQKPGSEQIPMSIISQSDDTDMVFSANVRVEKPCPTCIVVLKETYHPSWQVTVNGKKVKPIDVFPSYIAVRLEDPGTYTIVFSYGSSVMKLSLIIGAMLFSIMCFFLLSRKHTLNG